MTHNEVYKWFELYFPLYAGVIFLAVYGLLKKLFRAFSEP